MHGSHECDHRQTGKVQMSVTVDLADVTEGKVEMLSDNPTSMFPLTGVTEWLWMQHRRHWGGGKSMADDLVRWLFEPDDEHEPCPDVVKEGKFDKNGNWKELNHWQRNCTLKTSPYLREARRWVGQVVTKTSSLPLFL